MGRPRFRLLAPTLLVLVVVSPILLMHGFESVSPEPLATHASHSEHDEASADATAIAAAVCLFIAALVVTVANNLAVAITVPRRVQPRARRWTSMRSARWKPPQPSSYELCVMRV